LSQVLETHVDTPQEQVTVDAAPAHRRRSPVKTWATALAVPIIAYAVSRCIAALGYAIGSRNGDKSLAASFGSWDSSWYTALAANGYPTFVPDDKATTAAFFPLYPLLVRGFADISSLSLETSGLVVNTACGLAFVLGVCFLARDLFSQRAANAAAVVVSVFPGTFALSMAYTEGLMLALSAWCLFALRKEKWLAAGILAALATSTRSNAVALCFACAWAAVFAIKTQRPRPWRALIAPVLSPLGLIAFFGYLWSHTGQLDAWFRAQKAWGEDFDWGVRNLFERLPHGVLHPLNDFNTTVVAFGVVTWMVLAVFFIRSRPPGFLVVFVAVIAFLTLGSAVGPRPRFVTTAFPMLIAAAAYLKEWSLSLVVAVSASLLVVLCIVTSSTLYLTP
jgi:hypothetical protein